MKHVFTKKKTHKLWSVWIQQAWEPLTQLSLFYYLTVFHTFRKIISEDKPKTTCFIIFTVYSVKRCRIIRNNSLLYSNNVWEIWLEGFSQIGILRFEGWVYKKPWSRCQQYRCNIPVSLYLPQIFIGRRKFMTICQYYLGSIWPT